MKVKVRTHPVVVYYLTGEDAAAARQVADGDELAAGSGPCFTTEAFGGDGFAWDTAEAFEESYRDAFPGGGLGRA